ncbi:MAG: branched-chain amino acid ABC transporter permease [Acidilobaceae archaeon]
MAVTIRHLAVILVAYLIILSLRVITEVVGPIGPITAQLLTLIAFYVALGQAFNIFLGMTGYVDFGYVAFMALGMYGMATGIHRAMDAGFPGYIGLTLGLFQAIVFSIILALIVGGIALRLRGAYFAIATISVNEGLRYLIEGLDIWEGSRGLPLSGPLISVFGHEGFSILATVISDLGVFMVALLALIITYVFLGSRIGYALRAIREDEDTARIMGVDTTRYKIIAFSTSGVLGGLIGAMWSFKAATIYPPDAFNILYTVEAIVIVMLGGAGTLLGPLVSGTIYASSKYFLAGILPGFQLLIFAPLVLAIIILAPEGIVGALRYYIPPTRRFIA